MFTLIWNGKSAFNSAIEKAFSIHIDKSGTRPNEGMELIKKIILYQYFMRNESACLKNPHSKSAVEGNEQLIYQTKKGSTKWLDMILFELL